MKLKEAVELQVTHYDHPETIRVDKNDYFCILSKIEGKTSTESMSAHNIYLNVIIHLDSH